ncbi:hypothetical protein IFM89_039978 [Coptis chinensis]|uniref:Factor of DNA methylation 1-5/IDN2 domain-containing protein n=1 Tax=Coptis chinensis TaxID=261450 RepID=A0A835GTK3_9MAGN|nr:hypothetical protein IFM89_039978 [Coptis chinensis]
MEVRYHGKAVAKGSLVASTAQLCSLWQARLGDSNWYPFKVVHFAVNALEQDLLLCKEENEQLKKELREKVNTLEQELLLCKEENEKLKEELEKKVNTLEQDLLLCKEENEKLKEELREKVNTLEQDLLLCKEENEKFKEELREKGQQADIVTVKGMDVDEKGGDDLDKREADYGITERQFLTKKKELKSREYGRLAH